MLNQAALQTIRTEIDTDPETIGYTGKTALEISILMNEQISQNPVVNNDLEVDVQEIASVLIKRGKWEAVTDAADNGVAAGHADAFNLVEIAKLSNISDEINTSALNTTVTNLITAGVLTAADGQALKAIAQEEVLKSRAQILGFNKPLSVDDCQQALDLP